MNASDPTHWRRKYVEAVQAGDARAREITAKLQPLQEAAEKLQRAYDGAAEKSDAHRRLLDQAKDREQTLLQDRQEALETVVLLETKLAEVMQALGATLTESATERSQKGAQAAVKLRALYDAWKA